MIGIVCLCFVWVGSWDEKLGSLSSLAERFAPQVCRGRTGPFVLFRP